MPNRNCYPHPPKFRSQHSIEFNHTSLAPPATLPDGAEASAYSCDANRRFTFDTDFDTFHTHRVSERLFLCHTGNRWVKRLLNPERKIMVLVLLSHGLVSIPPAQRHYSLSNQNITDEKFA